MNTDIYKNKLIVEKERIEKELSSLGRINPEDATDWQATPDDMNTLHSDKNELADEMEEFEIRSAVQVELENRLLNIRSAIERIENNTYGKCEKCGKDIEEDRLGANSAAKTCKAHL